MRQRLLLACGLVAAVVYVATDVIAAVRWDGYSYAAQTISETFAIGAPTRPFVVLRGVVYALLVMAFGVGVRDAAAGKRSLRVVGLLLIGLAVVDLAAPFVAPMHLRGAERTLTDTMHIALASVDVLLILLIIGFGAAAFGTRFRLYSLATLLAVLGFGTLAGLDGPKIAANLPTPWVGVTERISVFSFMLWLVVFAVALLCTQGERRTERHDAVGGHRGLE